MTLHLSDEELMLMFRYGDAGAFEALFGRYHRRIVGFCRRAIGDDGQAEDVAQEVFLALTHNRERYEPVGSFRHYIFEIAVRQARSALRRRRPTPTLAKAAHDLLDATQPGPDERMARRELIEAIDRTLAGMPTDQRLAMALCCIEGMPYAEAATTLETPTGTVKSWVHRGRKELKDYLERLGLLGLI